MKKLGERLLIPRVASEKKLEEGVISDNVRRE